MKLFSQRSTVNLAVCAVNKGYALSTLYLIYKNQIKGFTCQAIINNNTSYKKTLAISYYHFKKSSILIFTNRI